MAKFICRCIIILSLRFEGLSNDTFVNSSLQNKLIFRTAFIFENIFKRYSYNSKTGLLL
ncbi:hypothetical protein NBO_643g0001 [Nosema bombycis CQ1]|uniref:Uncharacterized protein n=1 Tax=Nosema bombycis (strain CQ1 / CVCC 102059) TaxID=578461 RepID=R0KMP8_NOSB1|nr:hypothetical protein NBO_643g0001 [Nosema bombycis CQ1]|eukprot:EOB11916.1 hypothetical protein NBO_643g0001 [Nosema bombycis CQ1]